MGPARRIRSTAVSRLALLLLLSVGGCGGNPAATGSRAIVEATPLANRVMIITEPKYGEVVRAETVVVRGAAPAGALIVRDAQYAPDEQTVTSPDGTWSIPIKLRVGVNDLIFRVGDDPRTELVLTLTFTPLASIATPTPPPTSTPDAEWITAACGGAATLQLLGDRLPELQVALGARDEPAATAVIGQVEGPARTLRANIATVEWPPATAFELALSLAAGSTLTAVQRVREALEGADTDAWRQAILDTDDALAAVKDGEQERLRLQADTGFSCP